MAEYGYEEEGGEVCEKGDGDGEEQRGDCWLVSMTFTQAKEGALRAGMTDCHLHSTATRAAR